MRGERGCLLSLQSPNLGRGKISLVVWWLCFSGFRVEPQTGFSGVLLCVLHSTFSSVYVSCIPHSEQPPPAICSFSDGLTWPTLKDTKAN